MRIKLSLEAQLAVFVSAVLLLAISLYVIIHYWLNDILLAVLISACLVLPLTLVVLHYLMHPINQTLSALNSGFYNFLDNDFSVSIAEKRSDELGLLVHNYNKVSAALRNERVHLYQRELLLDTVIQSTPLSLLLVDHTQAIIYSNSSARQLMNSGKAINGLKLSELVELLPKPFSRAIDSQLSGLFTVSEKDVSETFHLTQNQFFLNGQQHTLYLFKQLTKEINRQEVNTWKKVIRLISHELNNSLAPITSLAHSGQLLCERLAQPQLDKVFETIQERARYLQYFIEGYAKFARLPKPLVIANDAIHFLQNLAQLQTFSLNCNVNSATIYCDPAQIQQAVINLIKNAHESGSPENAVQLFFALKQDTFEIQVKDRGKGMSEKNLTNALLPFYSTKASGTGLGLPLCREIVEAHGGKIIINNRVNGGLAVTIILPNRPLTQSK